jgi:hypothetical protein
MQASGMPYDQLDTAALTDDFENLCPDWTLYRQFPYSEPSEQLTARLLLADPTHYRGEMPYIESLDPNEPVPRGGFGLESVSDPALRAAYAVLRTEYQSDTVDALAAELEKSVYSFENQMYLIAAMAQYGDGAAPALEWFQSLALPKLTGQTDADGQPVLSAGNHADTAAALLAAAAVNAEEAAGLARWLLGNPSRDELYLLELMYYHRQIPVPDTAATVTYQQDGPHTLALSRGMIYRSFSKAQLEAAGFQPSGGDIWADVHYTAGLDDAMNRDNRKLLVEKTIEAADGGALGAGALARITVRVTIPEDVLLEGYERIDLEDYLPTGMRYDSMEVAGNGWYLSSRNDQRLAFSVSREYLRELVFYARCVAPGSYVTESAFASVPGGSLWGVSERSTVEIPG